MARPIPADHPQLTASYRFATIVLPPILISAMRRDWRGAEHLPASGGFVASANHVTLLDALAVAHFLWGNGYPPYFLAKDTLFRVPGVGGVIRRADQIPVYRGTTVAGEALRAAVAAVREGKCVVIFPEGTTTKDPQKWPMTGKTGAARVALETGCPVIPIGQWGSERILARGEWIPKLLPRHTVSVVAGPPVDLSSFAGGADDPQILRVATDRIMDDITALVAQLRGEDPPATRYQPPPRHGTSR